MISNGLKELARNMKMEEVMNTAKQVGKAVVNETAKTVCDCKIAVKETLAENRETFYGGKTMREYYAECEEMQELKTAWKDMKKAWNENKKRK